MKYLSVALLSSSIILFEMTLIRVLSIAHEATWVPFIVSLALLGYGASGLFVGIIKSHIRSASNFFFWNVFILIFALICCTYGVLQLPLNLQEILWDYQQFIYLSLVYLVLSIPFFLGSNAILGLIQSKQEKACLVYGSDLIGAGIGAAFSIVILNQCSEYSALKIAVFGAIGSLVVLGCVQERRIKNVWFSLLTISIILIFLIKPFATKMNPYKAMSRQLLVPETTIEKTYRHSLSQIDVLSNKKYPIRFYPDLSLSYESTPPGGRLLFFDGSSASFIRNNYSENDPLWSQLSFLPFSIKEYDRILILGPLGGEEILSSLTTNSKSIDVVVAHPNLSKILRKSYSDQRVHIFTMIPRAYLFEVSSPVDLIWFPLSLEQNLSGAWPGEFLFTNESIQTAYDLLKKDGVLVFQVLMKNPLRTSLKLYRQLKHLLNERTEEAIYIAKGLRTTLFVVKKGRFNDLEREKMRSFLEEKDFDLVSLNDFESSTSDWKNYPFDLSLAADDRPSFFHFSKLQTLFEGVKQKARGGLSLVDIKTVSMIASFLIAVVIGVGILLILMGVHFVQEKMLRKSLPVVGYFFSIGLGYMLFEIFYIKKLSHLLGNSVYSAAIVIGCFLVSSGLGSMYSLRFDETFLKRRSHLIGLVLILSLGSTLLITLYWGVWSTFLGSLSYIILILFLCPLPFVLGVFFPIGIEHFSPEKKVEVALAWGSNGIASVLGPIIGYFLIIYLGFWITLSACFFCYVFAGTLLHFYSSKRSKS